MGSRVLIDSNIVIDLLAGKEPALQVIQAHSDRAISIVTWIEVTAGLQDTEVHLRQVLSERFIVVALSPEVAEEASRLRRTTRLKLPDAVILATATVERRILMTRNTRDFSPGPDVHVPYRL